MKTYHPPGWEPIPIFEEWVAGKAEQVGLGAITTEQVGLGVILVAMVVVALVLRLRRRGESPGPAESDLGFEAQEPAGGRRAQTT